MRRNSTALTGGKKKLEVKEIKHSRIHALGLAKRWMTTKVSDAEFKLIMREMIRYGELKESLRNPWSGKIQGASQPDVKKFGMLSANTFRRNTKKNLRRPRKL